MEVKNIPSKLKKGILRITTDALKNKLQLEDDIEIIGADYELDRGIIKVLLSSENNDKLFMIAEGQQIPNIQYDDVTTDKFLYEETPQTNMSYGEAVQVLEEGKCVARKGWKGYWYLEDITGFAQPVIVYKIRENEKIIITSYQEVFAHDWMIVTPKQKPIDPSKTLDITKTNYNMPSDKDIKQLPYAARQLLTELFSGRIETHVLCEDKEKFTSRWFFYLITRNLVEVFPFAEGQMMSCGITPRGEAFLNKIRKLILE